MVSHGVDVGVDDAVQLHSDGNLAVDVALIGLGYKELHKCRKSRNRFSKVCSKKMIIDWVKHKEL